MCVTKQVFQELTIHLMSRLLVSDNFMKHNMVSNIWLDFSVIKIYCHMLEMILETVLLMLIDFLNIILLVSKLFLKQNNTFSVINFKPYKYIFNLKLFLH